MSKGNDKIKIDSNSFDKMTPKIKKDPKKKDPDKLSDNKLVAWFQNYWYYYKAPVLIASFVLLLVGIFIYDFATREEPDMRLYMITSEAVDEGEFYEFADRAAKFVFDVNGDGKTLINPQSLMLAENPQDDMEAAAYSQIMTAFVDETCVAFVVDQYVFDYMMKSDAIERLSFFEIQNDDDYKLELNKTPLMEGLKIADRDTFYLVFKTCNIKYTDDAEIQGMYDMFVDIAKTALGQK